MKRKNWKRTAAFVTSVTMATTMMPTDLSSLLVKAAATSEEPNEDSETGVLNWTTTKYTDNKVKKSFITALKVNGNLQTNVISNNEMDVEAGDKVEITSEVPLDIHSSFDDDSFTINFTDHTFEVMDNNGDPTGVYKFGEITKEGDVFKKNGTVISADDALAEIFIAAGYDIADETFTYAWNKNGAGAELRTAVVVTFAAKETENSDGTYTYSFTMPDDNSPYDEINHTGTRDTVTVDAIKKNITVNFYENEDNRTDDDQDGDDLRWTSTQEDEECDKYFVHLNIKPASAPAAKGYAYVKTTALENVVVGETVTITNDEPFVVHISDGINANSWFSATQSYDQKEDKYKAEFKMPKVSTNAVVDIVKLVENYSYTLSGNKLLAKSTNTTAINNIEAAQIVAKYYDSLEDANAANDARITDPAFAKKGTVITGAVPNGKYVVVKAARATKLTNPSAGEDAFSIVINGDKTNAIKEYDAVVAANDTIGANDTHKNSHKFNAAGTYEVTYKVEGKNDNKYTLTYSFKIASKDELTAEDVTMKISAQKDLVALNDADLDKIMSDDEQIKDELESGKIVNFMLNKYVDGDKTKPVDAEVNNSDYQFTVTPFIEELKMEDPNHPGNYILNPAKCTVEGYTSGSSLDTVYEFTIKITDPEFGGSKENPKKINIKWRVVSYDKIPHWNNNRFDVSGEDTVMYGAGNELPDKSVAIDAFGEDSIDLKRAICEAANANGSAMAELEAGNVDFQYIKAPGANRTNEVQDELDEWKTGLPTELGDYTVYVVYENVVQATVDVHITKYSLGIYADESDLTFTYGHKFELEKPTAQKDVDGNAVDIEISNLKCTIFNAVEELDDKGAKTGRYKKGNVKLTGADPVAIDAVGQLNAGHYFVEFTGTPANEDYSVNSEAQEITVNKKSLNDPSLVILIDPFNYDGATHDVVKERAYNFTVRDTDFDENDPRYNLSDIFKITEGAKRSAVGSYSCNFKLVNAADANTQIIALTNAINGAQTVDEAIAIANSALVIANEAVNAGRYINSLFAVGIDVDSEAPVSVKSCAKAASNKAATISATDTLIDAKAKVNEVIVYTQNALDKVNINIDNKYYDAYKAVELDNFAGSNSNMSGKWNIISVRANEKGKEGIDDDNWEVNAGLTWTDSKTTLYDNGKIHLEITRNANDKINKNKTSAKIKKFGVIVDKEGKLEAPLKYGVKYNNTYIGDIVDPTEKAAAESEKATAEKFLTFGNGFLEGGYTETSSPVTCASQTYKVNIKVKDAETGIWARPYIQYEDGTISYGDVKYVNLTNEAVERLDLWTAGVDASGKAVRKADLTSNQTGTVAQIKKNVKSGYNTAENKYYVYARYVDLQKAGFTNVAEVADFGIVADREGAIAAPVDAADLQPAEIAAAKKVLKKDTAKVVGHYNKNNTVLGVNEYAASVSLGNSDTGLWVRSYIDLGNGLVIYSEPMYIVSASKYYGNDVAGKFTTKWEKKKIGVNDDTTDKFDYYNRLEFVHTTDAKSRISAVEGTDGYSGFAAKAGLDPKNVEVVKTGVIADKSNLLKSNSQMILNSDFIIGENKGKLSEAYAAKITPKDTNDVSVRTYTTYKIKGGKKDVEVTVYGDIQTFAYNATSERVKYDADHDIYNAEDANVNKLGIGTVYPNPELP